MEKVLIIANEFPPMGGAGVQRTIKFVKYLPKFGYEPYVFTKEHVASLSDYTLLDELPEDLKVYRMKPYDMVNKRGLLRLPFKFLGTRIMTPDSEFFWYYFNRDRALDLIKKEDIKIIYSTSFPYSSHLLGLYIKKKMPKIKWIVDFRDEWTNNPYHQDDWYRRVKFSLEKKKELEVTGGCDYLITNTPFMLENFISDTPSLEARSTYIPNGYDQEDFEDLEDQRDGGDKFVITYTGSLYGRRNLDEFLDGLKISLESGQVDKDLLDIRVVGNIYKDVLDEYAEKYGLVGHMESFGYLPHKESIQMLYKTDILLLVIGKGKGSRNFYTGKIFEYIKANRPILAIVPEDGAAASVINETNTGLVVDPENTMAISQAINELYKNWKEGSQGHKPNWDKIENYSRESQTGNLAKIFDSFRRNNRMVD